MDGVVIDASIALTWCYPDEHSDYAYRILDALAGTTAYVPSHWHLEVLNGVIFGERKGRLDSGAIERFFTLIDRLPITIDERTSRQSFGEVFKLSRAHQLTSYDAAYLELAVREGLAIATLDKRLRNAAIAAGAAVFPEA